MCVSDCVCVYVNSLLHLFHNFAKNLVQLIISNIDKDNLYLMLKIFLLKNEVLKIVKRNYIYCITENSRLLYKIFLLHAGTNIIFFCDQMRTIDYSNIFVHLLLVILIFFSPLIVIRA